MRPLVLALIALSLVGCGERQLFSPDDVDVVVVDGILVVDRPLGELRLSRTRPPQEPIRFSQVAETGATVRIGPEGGPATSYVEEAPGVYLPVTSNPPIVQPETVYLLEIETARGEQIRARTLTPGRFSASRWLLLDDDATTERRELVRYGESGDPYAENQLVYDDGLLEARFVPADAEQLQVGLFSLDPDSDFVIDPDFFEEEDFEELERRSYSPIFLGADGFIRLPWLAIYFEGRYQIKAWSVDRNWSDYVRSNPELNGGAGFGGNLGDGFERPIFRVEGGIGLFGSAVVDSIGFSILPREGAN